MEPPRGRPLAAATCAARGPRPAFARRPKLCAHCSQRRPPRSQSRATKCPGPPLSSRRCRASAPDFSPLLPILTQGAPSRLRELGARPALGWLAVRALRFRSPPCRTGRRATPPRPAYPEPPTPERASATPSLTFPARRRGPHSPLSPLDSPSGCSRRGRGVSAFVPWGWQVRLGPGRAGNAAKVCIPDGDAQSQQLCRQQ